MTFDILIVGAGISGSIVARELANTGKKVLIIEKRNHCAGNIYDKLEENIFVHKYGPHIFHTDNEIVNKYMSNFWTLNNFRNKVLASVKDKLIPIPFNFEGIDLFFPENSEIIKKKLIKKFGNNTRVSIFDMMNADDKDIKKVAMFIYKNIFENYTTKMWGISPKNLDSSVMKRVPVSISYSKYYFKNKYEGIPTLGYTNAIEKILDHENIDVLLNTDALGLLKLKNGKTYYKGKIFNGLVVYSGLIDEILEFKFGELPYRSLSFEFKTIDKISYQETAVVNYPAHPKITRITEYKKMMANISDKTIISFETPGEYDSKSVLFSTPYYPLNKKDTNVLYLKYEEEIKKYKNFYPIGRLATFQYINMDRAVELALELSKRLIKVTKNGK